MKYVLAFILLAALVFSCTWETEKELSHEEKLSQQYCSSCHLYTPPDLLDKSSWIKVLTVMKEKIELTGTVIPKADWNGIYHFYYLNALFSLQLPAVDTNEMDRISIEVIKKISSSDIPPLITSISTQGDEDIYGLSNGEITFVSNNNNSNTPKDLLIDPVPVQIEHVGDDSLVILAMGALGPHHEGLGTLVTIIKGEVDTIVDRLHRPIHFSQSDLDTDGHKEYIISHFGSTNDEQESGGLWLYEEVNNSINSNEISSYTGASKTIVTDFDSDGLEDVLALFAQGDERIILYKNEGGLNFTEKTLLRFHPLYGCLDFEIIDINKDGKKDIVLVNGDNADYSPILKPYHGFRIFEQKENQSFEEKVFHHINGAAKLLLVEKDETITFGVFSLYPDLYTRPWETLQFITIDRSFQTKRMYQTDITGNDWVIAHIHDQGIISLGKNTQIQKNIPMIRAIDPLVNKSIIQIKIDK